MRWFRLTTLNFVRIEDAFSGEGSYRYEGRWNIPGQRMVYLSSSIALALLEMQVQSTGLAPVYACFAVQLPDDLLPQPLNAKQLPPNWRSAAAYKACQALSAPWYALRQDLLLKVPSAVVPMEDNALLNREHPDFARLTITRLDNLSLDIRL